MNEQPSKHAASVDEMIEIRDGRSSYDGLSFIDEGPGSVARKEAYLQNPNPKLLRQYILGILMNEYDEKLNSYPKHMHHFITQEMRFKCASEFLDHGYRDYEISMGETFSGDFSHLFQWFVILNGKIPETVLRRRRMWRKVIPYKWWHRHWYKIFPWKIESLWDWKRIFPIYWSN